MLQAKWVTISHIQIASKSVVAKSPKIIARINIVLIMNRIKTVFQLSATAAIQKVGMGAWKERRKSRMQRFASV